MSHRAHRISNGYRERWAELRRAVAPAAVAPAAFAPAAFAPAMTCSRRELLGLLAAGPVLAGSRGQSRIYPEEKHGPGKIDVHHHVGPPPGVGGGGGGPAWSPENAIKEMDDYGVATGIGFPGPIAVSADLERGRKLARVYNEYAAQIRARSSRAFRLVRVAPHA